MTAALFVLALFVLLIFDAAVVRRATSARLKAEIEREEARAELRAVERVIPTDYFPAEKLPDRVAQLVRDRKTRETWLWERE